MDEIKVEVIRTEDGRYAERHVREVAESDPCGKSFEAEKVIEQWEEDRPLLLKKRVREKRQPCVVERVIETIEDNEVVDVQVESIEPDTKLELRSHIAVAKPEVGAAKVDECYVTRDDLKEVMLSVTEQLKDAFENREVEKRPSSRMQAVVEEEVEQADDEKWGAVEWILLGIVAIEGAYLLVNWLPRLLG